MRIIANIPTPIDLDDETQKKICLEYILKHFKWGSEFYIEDGLVKEDVEYCGSHRWTETEIRKPASALDEAVNLIVKKLQIK